MRLQYWAKPQREQWEEATRTHWGLFAHHEYTTDGDEDEDEDELGWDEHVQAVDDGEDELVVYVVEL